MRAATTLTVLFTLISPLVAFSEPLVTPLPRASPDGLLPLHLFDLVTVDAPARALFVHNVPTSGSR